eukprot:COSAG02_NODE_11439_length_1723_cov_1.536330_2_plen_115_part_00
MLVARVNGLGRLIPTRTLNKTMFHRVVGGLEDPYLNRMMYLYNKPSTVIVTFTIHHFLASHLFCLWGWGYNDCNGCHSGVGSTARATSPRASSAITNRSHNSSVSKQKLTSPPP